jgi:hypothetical protein
MLDVLRIDGLSGSPENDRKRKEVSGNGRSKEKNIKGKTGLAPGAEYEDEGAGAFRVPALSRTQAPAQGLSQLQLL